MDETLKQYAMWKNQSQKTTYGMILFIEMFRRKKISRDKGVEIDCKEYKGAGNVLGMMEMVKNSLNGVGCATL